MAQEAIYLLLYFSMVQFMQWVDVQNVYCTSRDISENMHWAPCCDGQWTPGIATRGPEEPRCSLPIRFQ